MASEIIVLIDVGEEETTLIRGLISSFEIELCTLAREDLLERDHIFQTSPFVWLYFRCMESSFRNYAGFGNNC